MDAIKLTQEGHVQGSYFAKALAAWEQKMEGLQEHRLMVMGLILMVQGNIIVPISTLLIFHYAVPFHYIGVCVLTSFAVLVSNIATEKVKYSIPVFIASTILNLMLIIAMLIFL